MNDCKEKATTAEVNQSNQDGKKTNYCIRYENNASKQWDGKELLVDKEWLDELYPDIYTGKQVQHPGLEKKKNSFMECCCNR